MRRSIPGSSPLSKNSLSSPILKPASGSFELATVIRHRQHRRWWSRVRSKPAIAPACSAASAALRGDQPALIEARGESDHPVARDAAVGGLQAGDAASAAGWRIEPPVSVAVARRHQPRGHRRRRAARGAARARAPDPRVAHRAEIAGLVGRAHRELVHVGLAEHHGAGALAAARPRWHRRARRSSPSMREPQVVRSPRVQKMSLCAIGTPVSGPPSPAAQPRDRRARPRRARPRALTRDEGIECALVLARCARGTAASARRSRSARARSAAPARSTVFRSAAHPASLDHLGNEVQARPPPAARCAGSSSCWSVSVTTSARSRCDSPGQRVRHRLDVRGRQRGRARRPSR